MGIMKNELYLLPSQDVIFNDDLVFLKEKELKELFDMLNPGTEIKDIPFHYEGHYSPHKYMWGWQGCGKTTMLKWFAKKISSFEIKTIYIDCRSFKTPSILIEKIHSEIKRMFPDYMPSGTVGIRDEIVFYVKQLKNRQVFLILDEIDKPYRNSKSEQKDEWLHYIIRISEISNNPNFKVVFSTNIAGLHHKLSEEVLSYLRSKKINFSLYGVEEIIEILDKRAQVALEPNSYTKKDLAMIAQWCYSKFESDIRVALDMLRRVARESKNEKLDITQLAKVGQEIEDEIQKNEINNYPIGAQILLSSINKQVLKRDDWSSYIFSSDEIFKWYKDYCTEMEYNIVGTPMLYKHLAKLCDNQTLSRKSDGYSVNFKPSHMEKYLEV